MTAEIVPLQDLDRVGLLALNNAHATELSAVSPELLDRILSQATLAIGVAPMRAALIAFDEASGYSGRNFAWFVGRYPRFLYVDRVVVSPEARGQGLARLLYDRVFEVAGDRPVTCEVNQEPPNSASDAFHAGLGFVPLGTAVHGGKTVRYLVRQPASGGAASGGAESGGTA